MQSASGHDSGGDQNAGLSYKYIDYCRQNRDWSWEFDGERYDICRSHKDHCRRWRRCEFFRMCTAIQTVKSIAAGYPPEPPERE